MGSAEGQRPLPASVIPVCTMHLRGMVVCPNLFSASDPGYLTGGIRFYPDNLTAPFLTILIREVQWH